MKTLKIYTTLLVTFIILPFVLKAQWNRITNSPSQARSIYFYNAQTGYALKNNEIHKSTDGGTTWTLLPANFDSFISLSDIYFVSQDTGFVLLSNNISFAYPVSAYITYDGGNSWTSLFGPFDGANLSFHFQGSANWYFHMSSNWFTPADSIFQTTDAGATWTKTGNTTEIQYNQLINNLVVYKDSVTQDLDKLFYKSTDGGASYTLLLTDSTPFAGISGYQFLNNTDGYVLVYQYNDTDSINSRLYKTTNGGLNWTNYTLPSSIKDPQYMHFTSTTTGYIISHNSDSIRSEIFFTTDGGQTWAMEFTANASEYFFNDIAEYFQHIYVLGNNIIRKSIATPLNEIGAAAKHIRVSPNPFSGETRLTADKLLTNATLTMYNATGQMVKEIKNITGHYVTIERAQLSNGLYYVSITDGNHVITSDKLIITD